MNRSDLNVDYRKRRNDPVAKINAALGLNKPASPEIKCLNCGMGFYKHYRAAASEVTHNWCPDRKSSDGFSVSTVWLADTPINREKLKAQRADGTPCPDPKCGRKDGKHTILCALRPRKVFSRFDDNNFKSGVTFKFRRQLKKSLPKKSHADQLVSGDKQLRRIDMSREERRVRRALLRHQTGIRYRSIAHTPTGGYLP